MYIFEVEPYFDCGAYLRYYLLMLQSKLFTKTRKEAPKDEVSKNARLLIQAGFVHKEMAGVYAYLPLGLRVIENIKKIVKEEMEAISAQEILMTALQRKELWEKTDRWDDEKVDVWFKSKFHAGGEVGFGWSHEEPIADMMQNYISSFRDLPTYVYQFQTKLRNELRAKSGIMRGREFLMKDMYSFAKDEKEHDTFYAQAIEAYKKVFERAGVGDDTFVTFAAGGAFTEYSHEFQTIVDTGEDVTYINREKNIAINEEVLNENTLKDLGVSQNELEKVNTAEVGNIFNFGTKKCEELGLKYKDEDGKQIPVWLGSYGVGITRLMGVIVEKFSDEKGIVWPENIAPFKFHIIAIGEGKAFDEAHNLYNKLKESGCDVLLDDREESPGAKFSDADLLGIPYRVVISEKTLQEDKVELKKRSEQEPQLVTKESLFDM